MAINQITTSNTFQQWLTATQSLIAAANTLTNGNGAAFVANTILEISGLGSSLNVKTSGEVNELYSNTSRLTNVFSSKIEVSGSGATLNVRTSAGVNELYANTSRLTNVIIGNVEVTGIGSTLNVRTSADINTLYANTSRLTNVIIGNVEVTGVGSSVNVRTSADINQLYSNTSNLKEVFISGNVSLTGGSNTSLNVLASGSINVFYSNTASIITLDVNDASIDSANIITVNSATSISDIFKIDDNAYFTETGGGVFLAFDSNDYLSYNRSLNRVNLFINANNIVEVDNNATFSINGNTHLKVPVGTTAQRDANANVGAIRYNTTTGSYEGYSSLGWSSIGGGFNDVVSVSANTSANAGKLYVITANATVTLPASPTVGHFVGFSNLSGYKSSVVARNSENIMGLAEDMTIDSLYSGFTLYYTGATKGWIIL